MIIPLWNPLLVLKLVCYSKTCKGLDMVSLSKSLFLVTMYFSRSLRRVLLLFSERYKVYQSSILNSGKVFMYYRLRASLTREDFDWFIQEDIGGHPPLPLGPPPFFSFSFLVSLIVAQFTIFGSF